MNLAGILRDERGAAAAELALLIPLLLALFVGSLELGNYFYNEHKLVKAVRDGARYAARQNFSNYSACTGAVPTSGTAGTVYENTKLMVRKGTLNSTANDLLPNWSGVGATCSGSPENGCFEVTMSCTTQLTDPTAGNLALGGIYTNSTTGAPTVEVQTALPYRSLFGTAFGFDSVGIQLNARQQAAVAGL